MVRCSLICCILALTTIPVGAQEAVQLGTMKLDLNRLKTWGTRLYTYEATRPGSGEKAGEGRFLLKTTVANDGVTLDDTMTLTYRGKELSLQLVHQCRKDNYLSPTRIESRGEGDDELGTFVATVDAGKASVRSVSDVREIQLPEDTVTAWAFMRLVALLPRQNGNRVAFQNWLESEELNLKRDFVVECLGREAIPEGNDQITCTKFRLTGGGIMPAVYWVSEDDLLRQVLLDERKWIRLRDGGNADSGR